MFIIVRAEGNVKLRLPNKLSKVKYSAMAEDQSVLVVDRCMLQKVKYGFLVLIPAIQK